MTSVTTSVSLLARKPTQWLAWVCAVMLLAACSPDHDWRRVSVADGAVVAMLPGKPHTDDRELDFEGSSVTFTLASARVNDVMYTVGYAPLPEKVRASSTARDRFVDQIRDSLYRNLGASPPATQNNAQLRYTIEGEAHDTPIQAQVMAWATDDAFIEGIVLGAPEQVSEEHVQEFFRELAPRQQPD